MFVSVIIPIRNEEKYIYECLESIIAQSYPKDKLEVLLVDGLSDDNTRQIINEFSKKHQFIKILDNPKKIVPTALNIGIKASKGKIIIRLDAHAYYERDYIEKCVETLEKVDAVNVGGPIITLPGDRTMTATAIALATSHFFGVGNSKFRTSVEAQYVDTVPFGAFRREVFEKIGYFNENLPRNQDIELNSRIINNGMKIYLNPEIKSYYYNRSTMKGLWKQNFINGLWNIFTHALTGNPLSLRHYIPFFFVFSLTISFFIYLLHPIGALLFAFIAISYLVANLFFSFQIGLKNNVQLIPLIALTFITLHFSYGLGSCWGLLTVKKWMKSLSRST